jgi:hypothetical protein
MANIKAGDITHRKGHKLVVASVNADGTLTLNYAAGSGKTGFFGKVPNPDVVKERVRMNKTKGVDIKEAFDDVDGDLTLDEYMEYFKSDEEIVIEHEAAKREADLIRKIEADKREEEILAQNRAAIARQALNQGAPEKKKGLFSRAWEAIKPVPDLHGDL